jgi:hypothetical protein
MNYEKEIEKAIHQQDGEILMSFVTDFRRYLAGMKKRDLIDEEEAIVFDHLRDVARDFKPDDLLHNVHVALSVAVFVKVSEIHPELEKPTSKQIHLTKVKLHESYKKMEEIQNRNRKFLS